MTDKRIPLGSTGEQVRANIESIRTRNRMSYRELSERLEAAGRPIPTLGLSRLESGDRRVDVDDLIAIAAALEVTPVELLGSDSAQLFIGQARVECPSCLASHGSVESVTRADLAELADLTTLEPTLIETAYRLAAAIDGADDDRVLPALTKELRACVEQLAAGRRRTVEPDEDDFGDLDDPE